MFYTRWKNKNVEHLNTKIISNIYLEKIVIEDYVSKNSGDTDTLITKCWDDNIHIISNTVNQSAMFHIWRYK